MNTPARLSPRQLVVGTLLLFALLAALWVGLPLVEWLRAAQRTIDDAGAAGIAIFIASYVVAVLVFAPATLFTVAAGAIWQWWGIPIALAGAWLGSLAAFLLSRRMVSSHYDLLCEHHDAADRLNRVVAHLGWRGVLLSRLSPLVPFSLQNYLFGMTRVRLVSFAWAGLVGMLPATLVKVWVGVTGLSDVTMNWPSLILLGLGALATLWVAALFVRHWRSAA